MAWETDAVRGQADALFERVRSHRRTIHRHPELGYEEHRTAAYIEDVLDDLGVNHRRVVDTGIVATIAGDGGQAGRCVGIRADMDALPVTEARGRPDYRSRVEGVSHACGHDAHVAVVLGLAELLVDLGPLPGTVVLYFQPAEESPGGAADMVAAGVLDDPSPEAIVGTHVASQYPAGTVACKPGPAFASFDELTLTVQGKGGHGAHPESAVDPVPVAAEIVTATQRVISREVDPVTPAVLSYGSIHGGTKANIIPTEVRLEATLRAVHPEVRETLTNRVPEIARHIAAAHRAAVSVDLEPGYPVGHNDPFLTDMLVETADDLLGRDQVVIEQAPSMGSEDFFAFGGAGIPVAMFRLGVANATAGITAPHHSPDFDVDEEGLPTGVAVLAETVRRLLVRERP